MHFQPVTPNPFRYGSEAMNGIALYCTKATDKDGISGKQHSYNLVYVLSFERKKTLLPLFFGLLIFKAITFFCAFAFVLS